MKWNAFSLTSDAINKTGKRLFPFQFWEWFKLTVISFLAANRMRGNIGSGWGSGGGRGSGGGGGSRSLEEAKTQIREFIRNYWILGALIFSVFFLIMTIFSYIQSVFTFILIESLVEKKSRFTFSKNSNKGFSLFLFKFVITIITLLVLVGLAFPYVYHFMAGNPVVSSVGISYIAFSIIALIVYLFILWVLFLFLYDFAVPYTYVKGTSVRFSLSQIWREIKKNPGEVFIYWLARLVFTIVVGVIAVLIALLLLLVFALIGASIFGMGFLLYKLIGGLLFFIILGIILGVILFIIFLFAVGMCVLPFAVFLRYFELMNFEKLTKIKLFRSGKRGLKNGK